MSTIRSQKFTLDRNTSVITLTLKEGDLDLPQTTAASTADSTGGLLSGMLSSSSADSTAAEKNSDGTVTVRYKLPYAYVFIENVQSYIDSYDAANPTAPMEYDYTSLKETIPGWRSCSIWGCWAAQGSCSSP